MGGDLVPTFDDDQPSESRLHTVAPSVALVAADRNLGDRLSILIRNAGHLLGGPDIVSVAAVVVTDAGSGAKAAVAKLRATTRSDAAIVVVLPDSAPAAEVDAAYKAGAVLCLRDPVDEHLLLASVESAVGLLAAKSHVDDLERQLGVQAHLASLGRVTAGFTHEVSNPLATLESNLSYVRAEMNRLLADRDFLTAAADQPRTEAAAKPTRKGLSHLVALQEVCSALDDMGASLHRIEAVLATARALAQEGGSRHVDDVDLSSLVEEVRRWAAHELSGIEVQELIDEPLVARVDRRLLGQIVLNLVTNAANAVRQLPSPRVRLHVYASTDTAIVSVRDNGPGIPAELRDRIFEPFFTTRRGHGGTGLGLALCREYAARMGARLTLWTALGRGACFRVHLPRLSVR